MALFQRYVSAITLFMLSIACGNIAAAQSASPSPASPQSSAPAVPLDPPVTHTILEAYLKAAGTLEGNKVLAKTQLDTSRKKLPPWFPQSVWNEVERKVLSVDLVDVYLPVYQKYVNADTISTLTLLYEGPTGEELSRVSTQRMMDAIQKGSTGFAADNHAADSMTANGEDTLYAKRIKELTPEQRSRFVKAEAAYKAVLQPLDNEQNAAFANKVDEIWHATVKEHNAEIAAAQNAAKQ